MTRSAVRVIVVTVLAVWSMAVVMPSLARLWHPLGSVGLSATGDGHIDSVVDGSAAAKAGIHAGDRIDMRSTGLDSRRIAGLSVGLKRQEYRLSIVHDGKSRIVTLQPADERLGFASRAGLIARTITVVVIVATSAVLLCLHPSLVTWAFFLFCIGTNAGSHSGIWAVLPYPAYVAERFAESAVSELSPVGFALFMIIFPTGAPISRWSAVVVSLLPWSFGLLVASDVYLLVARFTAFPVDAVNRTGSYVPLLFYAAGVAAFVERYVRTQGPDRVRIRWVGIAMAIGMSGNFLEALIEIGFPGSVSYATLSFLTSGLIVVPFAVMYAVIRHHVIDVHFVVSHAIAYGAVTGALIAGFSVVDWFFTSRLSLAGVGAGVEILAAIVLGFSMNGIHTRLERRVDQALFQRRYTAELRLREAATALPHARSRDAINVLLVDAPFQALDLTSAALFRRNEDGQFVREAAQGWSERALRRVARDDSLILHLESGGDVVRLPAIGWAAKKLPSGDAQPVMVVPISVRNELAAFVMYGPHRSGADIDPDEERSVVELAGAAATAYDHVRATELMKALEASANRERALREALKRAGVALP